MGTYADGSYWVVGPVTVTNISPAFNGNYNGSMVDPRPIPAANGVVYSGYDTRGNYNAALRAQPPITFANDGLIRSLVSTIGNAPGVSAPDPYGSPTGSYTREIRVLTVEPATPPADSFRPNYLGVVKLRFRLSEMNLGVFDLNLDPNRYAAQIPAASVVEKMVTGGTWGIESGNWGDRYFRPSNSSPGYGQYFATMTGELALYILHSNLPYRQQVIRTLIQYGIDLVGGTIDSPTLYSRDGGQTNGHKIAVFLLTYALNPSAIKNSLISLLGSHPFSENGQVQVGTPHFTPNTGHAFAGFSSTGAVETQHPSTYNGGLFHAVRYKYCCTITVFDAPWLVVSLLDGWNVWQHMPFKHYVWGYYEVEDIYSQGVLLDYYVAIYNASVPPNQQISGFGTWFANPTTGHGTHYSDFARRIWELEAASLYP